MSKQELINIYIERIDNEVDLADGSDAWNSLIDLYEHLQKLL